MNDATAARVRIAIVQWGFDRVSSFDAFATRLRHFVTIARDYRADFVLFPELFTCELLSASPTPLRGEAANDALHAHTDAFVALLQELAQSHGVNIIGGSHLQRIADGSVRNVCHVALRDGTLHRREKLHITPSETSAWSVQGGDSAATIATDRGTIAIAICYDSEFPELTRHLVAQGAEILFVPFCTDDRYGYLRVRQSSAARAIENQIYVALAGNVGILKDVPDLDQQYAQSCVLTPCDVNFARDGIAVEATANIESLVIADVDLAQLREARTNGTVRNLRDRRLDLYPADGWLRGDADTK
jgi:predicted amidohydrolase